jgi:hypothetical protein
MLCRAPDISAGPTYTWLPSHGVASALSRRPGAMICTTLLTTVGTGQTKRAFKRNILGAEEGKINDH